MKYFGRLVRCTPLFILPAFTYKRIFMQTEEGERMKAQKVYQGDLSDLMKPQIKIEGNIESKEVSQTQQIKQQTIVEGNLEHNVQVVQEKAKIDQQNVVLQTQHGKTITQSASQSPSSEQSSSNIDQNLHKIQQNLQINEVIINNNCPKHILSYLRALNLTIKTSQHSQHQLTLKNTRGQILTLNSQQSLFTHKDDLKLITNFMRPPLQIQTIDQMTQQLKLITKDDFLVVSYIPFQSNYQQLIKSRITSPYDNYTTSRKVDLVQTEKQYVSHAYNSSSNHNSFAIIRNKQVADYMKINNFKIGEPFLYNLTTKQSGNESNCHWHGQKYMMRSANKLWEHGKGDNECINKLTHHFINNIQSQTELENKIRQMQMAADKRKVLLFHTNQHRQQFHTQTDTILQKLARMQRDQVIVIKTQNQQLIRKVLKVEPDNFATIRLINLHQLQKPLFPEHEQSPYNSYSRSKYRGPFKLQNLCEFILSNKQNEYYQSKRNLTSIKPITARQLHNADKTLVLMQKQGCSGCKYMVESLDELKKVVKTLKLRNKTARNIIFRYRIQDQPALLPLKIRRYNIYNEDQNLQTITTTPKLFLFTNGKPTDIKAEESINKLNSIKTEAEAATVHDVILSDLITKITRTQNDILKQQ